MKYNKMKYNVVLNPYSQPIILPILLILPILPILHIILYRIISYHIVSDTHK